MRLQIITTPQFSLLNFLGVYQVCYSLSDFSYDEFLIFENNKPIYYLNLFNKFNKELRDYINLIDCSVEEIIKKIGDVNKLKLSCTQKIFGIDNLSKQKVIEMDLPEFPNSLWDKYKNTVLKKS